MKSISSIMAGFLAIGAIQMASAQTVITLTGSSAFRAQTHTAILAVLSSPTYGYTGGTIGGANAAIFKGTFGGNSVIIKTSWSGSAAGIQTVAATSPTKDVGVFDDTETTNGAGISGKADPRTGSIRARPDIAMSDNTQSSTRFNNTFLSVTYTTLANATITPTTGTPAAGPVGIVPFKWVASASAPGASLNLNMTPQIAQAIYTTTGAGPLALFTGNSADRTTAVYAGGRDPDSGTRINAFAETGIGANGTVQQYKPGTISSGVIGTPTYYPAGPINGVPVGSGEGGESSGGTLAGLLKGTGPTSGPNGGGFFIAYLGLSDAADLIGAGGKEMKYNGATYSEAAVVDGQYTFWGYERLFYRTGTTGTVKTFGDAVASSIYNAVGTLNIFDMKVSRPTDGGLITATYF